jgi:hypothetical protein
MPELYVPAKDTGGSLSVHVYAARRAFQKKFRTSKYGPEIV